MGNAPLSLQSIFGGENHWITLGIFPKDLPFVGAHSIKIRVSSRPFAVQKLLT